MTWHDGRVYGPILHDGSICCEYTTWYSKIDMLWDKEEPAGPDSGTGRITLPFG